MSFPSSNKPGVPSGSRALDALKNLFFRQILTNKSQILTNKKTNPNLEKATYEFRKRAKPHEEKSQIHLVNVNKIQMCMILRDLHAMKGKDLR